MIAADVPYDWLFVAHLAGALATVVVLVTLRVNAQSASTHPDAEGLAQRFPDRTDWAARVVHVMLLTGLSMSLTGGHSVAPSRPWVMVGVTGYLVLAAMLEGRVLPAERAVARALRDGTGCREAAVRMGRWLDGVLAVLLIVAVAMIVQF